jgi:hypothetical protein
MQRCHHLSALGIQTPGQLGDVPVASAGQRQIQRLERLPRDHEVLSIDDGPLIVRGPKGKLMLMRVKANGRLVALVARFRSYL